MRYKILGRYMCRGDFPMSHPNEVAEGELPRVGERIIITEDIPGKTKYFACEVVKIRHERKLEILGRVIFRTLPRVVVELSDRIEVPVDTYNKALQEEIARRAKSELAEE